MIKRNNLKLFFSLRNGLMQLSTTQQQQSFIRTKTTSASEAEEDLESPSLPPSFDNDDELKIEEAQKPKNFFNKSRLLTQHRRMLHEEMPYDEPHSWIHLKENYQRKMYGRYGSKSGVNPRICFPNKTDLDDRAEYEKVAYPFTVQQMMEQNEAEKKKKEEIILKRQNDISKKLEKLDLWKAELNAKIAKKEADALAAKQRKERIVEEVRRHFGFKVDPRDERFKELLEQKEREDKKKVKEAKRKAKDDKMMAKLLETNKEKTADPSKLDPKSTENLEKND